LNEKRARLASPPVVADAKRIFAPRIFRRQKAQMMSWEEFRRLIFSTLNEVPRRKIRAPLRKKTAADKWVLGQAHALALHNRDVVAQRQLYRRGEVNKARAMQIWKNQCKHKQ